MIKLWIFMQDQVFINYKEKGDLNGNYNSSNI